MENYRNEVVEIIGKSGIEMKFRQPTDGNKFIKGITVRENWTTARVILQSIAFPFNHLTEALVHAIWLRNRVPSSGINGKIPIHEWEPNVKIDFKSLLTFGEDG